MPRRVIAFARHLRYPMTAQRRWCTDASVPRCGLVDPSIDQENVINRDSMFSGRIDVKGGVVGSGARASVESPQGPSACSVPQQPSLECHCGDAGHVAVARQGSRFAGQTYVSCSKPRGNGHGRCRYFALLCDCVAVATAAHIEDDQQLFEMFSCEECSYLFVDPKPVSNRFINE